MAPPKCNQLWKRRKKHGRSKIYSTPNALWKACCEYFQWVEENPIMETKAFAYQGSVTKEVLPKMRAMTIGGLCIYLDICRTTWDNYRENKELVGVVTDVEEIIREQKFTGAAADLLNSNIIARDLGLKDQQESVSTVKHEVEFLESIKPTIGPPSERNS